MIFIAVSVWAALCGWNPFMGQRGDLLKVRGEALLGAPFNPFDSGRAPSHPSGSGAPFGTGKAFPSSDPSSDVLTPVSPPTALLAVVAATAMAAVAIGVIGWANPLAVLGWVLAGPIAIGVLALFVHEDTKRRAAAIYVRPDWIKAAYVTVAVVVVAAIIVTALATAFWVGRW